MVSKIVRAHADHRIDAVSRGLDQRIDDEDIERIDHRDRGDIVDFEEGNHLQAARELLGNDVAGFGGVEAFEAREVGHFGLDADALHDFFFGGEAQIDEPLAEIFFRSAGGGHRLIQLLLRNDADFDEDFAQVGAAAWTDAGGIGEDWSEPSARASGPGRRRRFEPRTSVQGYPGNF